MDQSQYSTLMESLAVVPDPRKARGKRFSWLMLLCLLASGLASGHQTAHAIAQWLKLQAEPLRAALPLLSRLPSESTLLRTLRLIDVAVLERTITGLNEPHTPCDAAPAQIVTPAGTILQAHAVDGKALRGATACGAPSHLVSLVQHGDGVTLAQAAVPSKRNEITAVPAMLAGRDLSDTIITSDALITQRAFAEQVIALNGYYFMMVKGNQPQMRDDLALLFELPAIACDNEHMGALREGRKGPRTDRNAPAGEHHGRLELCGLARCDLSDTPHL